MAIKMELKGGAAIEAALFELKSATAKSVGRRVLKKAGAPIADATNGAAPVDDGDLSGSYVVTSRLNGSQAAQARKEGRDDVFMYIGTNNPAGQFQEFGTDDNVPQPHFRPAWESGKAQLLTTVATMMGDEVMKSVARARRKAARG